MKSRTVRHRLKYEVIKLRRRKKLPLFLALLTVTIVFSAHIWFACYFANDDPGDSKTYIQLAVNLLDHGIYSVDTEAPYNPTLIRLPGYPLFLAAVYGVFGDNNNTAVRVIQATLYTLTCLIAGLIAAQWVENRGRRRQVFWSAFVLSAVCPFTIIYSATILTETVTTFLMAVMTLTATYALKSTKRRAIWWAVTGLVACCAVFLRPDSGLFAFGIGLTLVIVGLFFKADSTVGFFSRVVRVFCLGVVFSVTFSLPLVPWAIRNEQLFGVFQPLAPTHAEMPGEFVSHGYFRWVRTWIDDQKYIDPMLWRLGISPIKIEKLPASAFDSDEEKAQVAALIDQYNNSAPKKSDPGSTDTDKSPDSSDSAGDDDKSDKSDDSSDDQSDNKADDKSDDNDDSPDDQDKADDADTANSNDDEPLKISPEVDAGFAQIAEERIARNPFRYYVWLPAERAIGMWFDTHSTFYSFDGELLPLKDLDIDEYQHVWLPLFAALVWIYTLLMAVGAFFLWRAKDGSWRWLLLATLMTMPRIMFFATLENPEPRYVIELFVFTAILGAIALARLRFSPEPGKILLGFSYGRDVDMAEDSD